MLNFLIFIRSEHVLSSLVSRSILAPVFLSSIVACSGSSEDRNPANANAGAAGNQLGSAGAGSSARTSGNQGGSGGLEIGVGGTGEGGSSTSVHDAAATARANTDAGADVDVEAGTGGIIPDKLVAFTFDDGPDATLTGAILDKLEAHDIPASFFLIGQKIGSDTQAVLQRASALGCEFENHSNGFGSLRGLSAQEIATSVDTTSDLIEQFTGSPPQFFRAPSLQTDAQMFQTIDLPFAGGIVGGDFPADSNGGNPTVQAISDTVLTGVQNGSIVLLHDFQPQLDPQLTADALDIIVPALKLRGYEFVTLRQLFTRRGVNPNSQQDIVWESVPPSTE